MSRKEAQDPRKSLPRMEFRAGGEMEMEMEPPTEVLDALPKVAFHIEGKVVPHVVQNPNQVTIIPIIGGSGEGKGVLTGQAFLKFVKNHTLLRGLEKQGYELQPHYASTASLFKKAGEHGVVPTEYELQGDDVYEKFGAFITDTVALSTARLPRLYPNKTHVLFLELVAVLDTVDVGKSALEWLGQYKNAFPIAMVGDDKVRARALSTRTGLWTPDADRKQVLERSKLVTDLDPEEVIYTMGNVDMMLFCWNQLNQELVERRSQLGVLESSLNNITPEILQQDDEIRMRAQRIRYNMLLGEWFGQSDLYNGDPYIFVVNRFLGDVQEPEEPQTDDKPQDNEMAEIHYYAGELKKHALPVDIINPKAA